MDVTLKLRDPFYPHSEIAVVRPSRVSYGFQLHRASRASFDVSRADINNLQAFNVGMFLTLERSDKLFPWAGFITERVMTGRGANANFACTDLGYLLQMGVTAKHWTIRTNRSTGALMQEVLTEAARRGEPPLQFDVPAVQGGPAIDFQVRGEALMSFVRTMEKWSGWEFGWRHHVKSSRVRSELLWQERLGLDRTSSIPFVDGGNVVDVKFIQAAEGFIQRAVAVGGTGTFADRLAESASPGQGSYEGSISSQVGDVFLPGVQSPALQGTLVTADSRVTNRQALAAAARRLLEDPDRTREALELTISEAGTNLDELELGSQYRIRFKDLGFGLGLERRFRITGMSFGADGEVRLTTTVLDRSNTEETRLA